MPDVNDILNQYIANNPATAAISAKMASVAAAAEAKKAELAPQGYLDAAARDVGYGNTPIDITQPVDVVDLIARQAGDSQYMRDATRTRSVPEAALDSANSAAQALFTTPLEIGNLGISAVSPDAGAAVTRFIQDGLNNAQAKQSDPLNARRRAYAARSQITSDVNQVKYNEEVGKDGSVIAGLRRVGRDAIDAVKNTDGVLASDLIANAAGSLLTAGPIGEGLGLAGKALLRGAMKTGAVGFGGARTALTLGSKLEMPLSIGLQEAGGVGHQTAAEILNMSHEDLAANSPEYRDAISQGLSPEQARNLVARNAGLEAAAIQGPIAAVTGSLVGQFEKAPFKIPSVLGAAGNVLKEGVEEGIQSGTGQLAQNVATQGNANENQDLLSGVGEQIAQGALGGLGSAVSTQGPGAAVKAAADTIRGAANLTMRGVNAAKGAIDERYNALQAANEKSSPVSDENVRSAVDTVVAAAPDVQATVSQAIDQTKADDAQKARANDYVGNLVSATQISPDELADPDMPAHVRDTLAGSKDRLDAMQRLAGLVEKSPEGSLDQLTAAATLYNTMSVVDDALHQTDAGAIDELPNDHPAKELVGNYESVLSSIRQSASVAKALNRIDEIAKAANEKGELKPVSDAELSTPEGQQRVQSTIAVAQASPLNANPEANDTILRHAEQGNVQLTTAQRVALQASSALVRAEQARQAELARLNLTTNRDVVSQDILTRDSGQEGKQLSVASHVKRIIAAARSGDQELTAAYLNSLVRFAQHMQNKVGALNEALNTGADGPKKHIRYQALTPSGRFMQSPENVGMWVNPYAPGSVKTAQQIAADAEIVGRVANDLVKTFPDLGIKPVETVQLDQSLNGPAEEVSKAFREGRVNKAPGATNTSTPEPAATGQPEGGDQSTEAKTTEPVDRRTELNDKAKKEYLTLEENAQRKALNEAAQAQSEASPATESAPAPAEADAGATGINEAARAEPKKTIADLFPKLPEWSRLKKIFRVPAEPKTRIIGTEKPLEVIKQALSSAKSLQEFLGSDLKHDFTEDMARDYGKLLSLGDNLKDILTKRLAESKVKARFLKGEDRLPSFRNGKILNLTDEVDGDLVYNQELLEGATLAGLQWLLVADRFQSILDSQDVADILGVPDGVFSDGLVNKLNEGLGLVEAKRSLARMIKSYWGLSDQPNAPIGQLEGIPEAMAAEVLKALVEAGGLSKQEVEVTEADGLPEGQKRTLFVFTPIKLNAESPLLAFPDAIDRAVLTEPEPVSYIGEPPKKVAETQLRNPDVKLTEQQKEAIRFEQKQPHYANLPMVNLFTALGLDNVLKLFGAGDLNSRPMNAEDRKSKDGLNRTFGSAYLSLAKLMAELKNRAGVAGVEVDQLPIYYDYAFTRVNRMQMLGLNNPQASKLMREAVLPTRSTLDLSSENSEHFSAFALALAQALGVKVHNVSREDAYNQVSDLLADKLANSVTILEEWLKDQSKPLTAAQVETIKSELGKENTPVALHALVEFARYQNADEAGRKAFTTSLYVEADGVTNGPVNAMQLLTPGGFTTKWLNNIRKGGLFVGSSNGTMNDHRQFSDPEDLYTTTTNTLGVFMADFTRNLKSQPEVDGHMTALSQLMDMLLPDVTFDGNDLVFKRGMAKNPLTITIYGSGAKGIAGKVAQQLTEVIYEKLSAALLAKQANNDLTFAEAMFPDAVNPAEQLKKFYSAINALTTQVVRKSKGQLYVDDGEKVPSRKLDPETFAFDKSELRNLRQNMLTLFVEPLRASINDTIGGSLMDATDALRQAVQIQSIFLEHAFKQAVEEKLAEKAKDPEWTKDDFLSRDELNQIFKELAPLAPIIETHAQHYYIAHSQSADVGANEFGSSLDDDMRTPAYISGPSDAGVAGIPAMVIGSGDGMMMQLLSTMKDAPDRTLKIFDGMNMPLDAIAEGSQKANQAVFDSWQGNPLQAVSKSYTAFLEAFSTDNMSEAQIKALTRALNLQDKMANVATLNAAIHALGPRLEVMANQVEARHRALARVGLSVDQMAAVGSPYVHEGEVSLEGLPDQQIVTELNRLAREEAIKLKKPEVKPEAEAKTDKPVSENIAPELEKVGRLLKNGARVVSYTALKKLVRSLSIPAEQKAILGDVLRTLTTKEYKIVYGSPEQVQAYADERGLNLQSDESDKGKILNGFIIPSHQTIYLHNPTSEILVHELIHAATFDKLQAYYNGESLGPNAAEQMKAIQRIEGLMNEFLNLSMHKEDEATQKAFFDATDEIEFRLGRGEKAAALNEFMAWGLANSKLQDLQKKTVTSQVVNLARKVVLMIKQLVAGKRQLPAAGNDMFSNLRFNTNILLQTKFDARRQFASTALFHAQSYGNSTRLMDLNRTLNRKVIRHLRGTITGGSEAARNRRIANEATKIFSSSDAIMHVIDQGFSMNAQERTTFQVMVSVLGTAIELDPNALSRVQDLYAHVVKNLHVDNFLADEDANDPGKQYLAEQKVNLIVGDLGAEMDSQGRSSLLPVFLALATVNDEFRSVLSKMDVPKSEKKSGKSLDAIVENLGQSAVDGLTSYVSGDSQKSPHVQASIDALIQRIMDTAEDRQSFFQQMVSPLGNAVDAANQFVVDAMQSLAEATMKKADEVKANSNSKLVQTVASAAKGLAGIVDERTGAKVAEGLMAGLNRSDVWKPIHELINDLIGRTESNASIYDMIKQVRQLVQQQRQQYREHLPSVIASKFSRKVTDAEWTAMFHGLGKTDLAVLRAHLSHQQVLDIIEDPREVVDHIERLERQLKQLDTKHWQKIQEKAKQLAHWMNTGEYGTNFLRNANAVANLFGEGFKRAPASDELVATVDQLTTLYAFDGLSQPTKDALSSLVQSESDGISFVMDYLVGQRHDELAKTARGSADVNHYKGTMPVQNLDSSTIIAANDEEHADLLERSFIRVADYKGSNLDRRKSKGYYFAPVSGRAAYNQGILQDVRPTAYGIDLATGFTHGLTAGRIEDPARVKQIYQNMHRERATEPLLPVYDSNGGIVAFERSIDPKQLARLKTETNLSKVIGIWRGRQLEELEAQHVNERLIDHLHEMWQRDLKEDRSKQAEYIDVRDPRELKKDPVLADAVRLISSDTHAYIDQVFGDKFYVRRDMLNDALGYRSASVGDLWTKNSRMNRDVIDGAKKVAMAAFGNQAYEKMVKAEKVLQNLVTDARILIVVKSVVVPVTNMIANVYQLWGRGVPIADIVRGMPRKTAEVNAYIKSRLRLDEAEAELRAAVDDPAASRRLKAEMQSIRDSHRRMSIWPLIEAGEFSSISDGTLTHDDLTITEGRLSEWIEKKVDQLPASIRDAGRYAIISRDTALFQALQRSVEYGDFLAKAVLYDHLTKQKKLSSKDAIARVTEEFVNYDRLPGRSRGYLESLGVFWFWNYKIRSVKVALSTIRNNPVHAFLSMAIPHPTTFGSVGSPIQDNLFAMAENGDLGWSVGPGMGLRSGSLNPWVNLVS